MADKPLRDIYPAWVQLPDGERLQLVRARIYPDRLEIYVAAGSNVVLLHDLPVTAVNLADPANSNAAVQHRVTTAEGDALVARQLGACACRAPLAGMRL